VKLFALIRAATAAIAGSRTVQSIALVGLRNEAASG
jgi:hypothetical protein